MRKKLVPTEDEEQCWLLSWAEINEYRWPELGLIYHIPNEGKRSWRAGRELKAQGLKPGVPDIVLPVPNRHHIALWIEMKRRKDGRVSEAQKRMMFALKKYGNMTVVCYGWEQARDVILNYLRQ